MDINLLNNNISEIQQKNAGDYEEEEYEETKAEKFDIHDMKFRLEDADGIRRCADVGDIDDISKIAADVISGDEILKVNYKDNSTMYFDAGLYQDGSNKKNFANIAQPENVIYDANGSINEIDRFAASHDPMSTELFTVNENIKGYSQSDADAKSRDSDIEL
jgi:hypothetical protein